MDRRLRVNVTKRYQIFFFQNDVGRNFTGDDFLEDSHVLNEASSLIRANLSPRKVFREQKKRSQSAERHSCATKSACDADVSRRDGGCLTAPQSGVSATAGRADGTA